jgi:hypothetical protein
MASRRICRLRSSPRRGSGRPCTLLDDGQVGRQRTGAQQDQRDHSRVCVREVARDLARTAEDRFTDLRSAEMTSIVEDNGKKFADILLCRLPEAGRAAWRIEAERDDRFVGALVVGCLCIGEILAGDDDPASR